MMALRTCLFCWFLIGCFALAAPRKVREDILVEDAPENLQNEVGAEPTLDGSVVAQEQEEDQESEGDAIDEEAETAAISQKVAEFIKGYKKTVGEINSGIEVINQHIEKASKKIGDEIKQTFARIKRAREEL